MAILLFNIKPFTIMTICQSWYKVCQILCKPSKKLPKDLKFFQIWSHWFSEIVVSSEIVSLALSKFCYATSFQRWRYLPVWPDWAKFCHFGRFFRVYLLSGKMLSLLWQICDIIGLIFIVANGQVLNNNLTIWSYRPWWRYNS